MRTALRARRNRFAWRDDLCRRLHLDDDQWNEGRLVGLSIETAWRSEAWAAAGRVVVRHSFGRSACGRTAP